MLGRLSGPICDGFLERTGSEQLLQELERRQIFTYVTDDHGGYRYHEVLRSHLEQVLVEELGEFQARTTYRRAGELLEATGAFPEAVQAFSRGEDWEAVDRLLRHQGGELLEGPDTWIDALPPALLRQDPWLMLGSARRHRAEGRWREAIDAYNRAEKAFGSTEAGIICQTERKALAGWLEPTPMPGTDWAGVLRRAVAHDPLGAKQMAGQLPEATGKLTSGIVSLLAGQMEAARRYLNAAAESRDATNALATAARLWSGVAALMSGDLQGVFDLEQAADGAEAIGLGWLARLARASMVLTLRRGSMAEADAIRAVCEREGDRWGTALVALMQGWAALYAGENAIGILEPTTDMFRQLGAGVLEAWSRSLLSLALARIGAAEAREAALQAENLARYSGTPGARYFPYGLAVDSSSAPNLYITDSFNHRVRKVSDVNNSDASRRIISTVAGDGNQDFADGSAAAAHFDRPWSASLDQESLFVADYLNQRVRKVDLRSGTVSTVSGLGSTGLKGDVGPAIAGELDGPRGLSSIGTSGALLVADSFNNRLRWVGVTQAGIERTEVNFDPTNLAGSSQPQSVTVQSTGTGLLVMGAVDLGANSNDFYLNPATNTCAGVRLEPGTNCSFQVAFQPRAPGSHSASVVIPDDATGGQQLVKLNGQATAPLVTLSPPAVVINQPADTAPTPQVVTLSNNGNGLLHITGINLDPGSDPDFGQSNNCPSVMAPHSTCAITLTMSQIAPGDKRTRTGVLTVHDDAAGNTAGNLAAGGTTQSVPLTGSLAQSAVTLSPQNLTFIQNVGTPSSPQTMMLINSGAAPLHLTAIKDAGDFVQVNNCPQTLAPGASCSLNVSFLPSTTGERDGYIVVADDSLDSPQKIAVTGIATMAMAHLGPDRLDFSQNIGESSPVQTATLTNTGNGPLTIQGVSTTGDYHATPRCPSALLPQQSCTIAVTFTPQAPGVRKGALVVTDDANAAPGTQETVRLNGFGYEPIASLSATTINPSANVGNAAAPQSIVVTNTGDGSLTIRGLGLSGPAAGDYSQASSCIRTLTPGASCSITVNFTPRAYGARNATLTLFDNGSGGSQVIALHGSGAAPHALLSSSFLNFGGRGVGGSSAPQNVVLFNSGTGTLTISGLTVSAGAGDFSLGTSCGSTLVSGASCMISVSFSPQSSGPRSGAVTISDNAGTQRITLSGVGT